MVIGRAALGFRLFRRLLVALVKFKPIVLLPGLVDSLLDEILCEPLNFWKYCFRPNNANCIAFIEVVSVVEDLIGVAIDAVCEVLDSDLFIINECFLLLVTGGVLDNFLRELKLSVFNEVEVLGALVFVKNDLSLIKLLAVDAPENLKNVRPRPV